MNKKKARIMMCTHFNCDHRRGNYCCFQCQKIGTCKILVITARLNADWQRRLNIMKNLTLEQLIRATELCGAGAPGSCPECPCFDPSGDFECIEYLMSQAAAALKEYSCNGGGEL